jgi:protein TonB
LAHVAIEIDDEQRRNFRRVLGFSGLAHALAFAALAWMPSVPSMSTPTAIAVNLVASPGRVVPPPPAAKPPPKTAKPPPVAKPRPKPPKPAPVVLPKEPTLPKPTAKPTAKPRPEPKPPPEPVQEPAEEQNYADVMASLRDELGEEPTAEPLAEPPAAAALPAGGSPGGQVVSAEMRAWMIAARIRIKNNWVVPASFRMASIAAEVRLEVDASGGLLGDPELVAGSGNPFYDEGVLRSIVKASPLPPPPEPGRWTFRFLSDDF